MRKTSAQRLAATLALGLFWLSAPGAERSPSFVATPERPTDALRAAWIRATQGGASADYAWRADDEAAVAQHGSTRVAISRSGLTVSGGGTAEGSFALRTEGFGRGDARPASVAPPSIDAARPNLARMARAELEELWVNGPLGVEHLYMLDERPPGDGLLEFEISVRGATARTDGAAIALVDAAGAVRARYGDLYVEDADGRRLLAVLEAETSTLRIRVDDRGARYPIIVDPLLVVEESILLDAGPPVGGNLGRAVALSADGMRAVVGAPQLGSAAGSGSGAAIVFVRGGTGWTVEARLEIAGASENDGAGTSVGVSDDGMVAAVGVAYDDTASGTDAGSVRVFARTGTTWTEQATVTLSGGAASDGFGAGPLALSADGTTLAVGMPLRTGSGGVNSGAVIVLVRSAGVWTEQGRLEPSGAAGGEAFGDAIAISADGNTLLAGARGDESRGGFGAGSARVFGRAGSAWSERATLAPADLAPGDALGTSVALSDDGTVALVGAPADDVGADAGVGSGRVFVLAAGTWSERAVLTVAGATPNDGFGQSCALSGDGATAALGAPSDDTAGGINAGTAAVFASGAGIWSEQARLAAAGPGVNEQFATAIALARDGSVALAGVPGDGDTGAGPYGGSAEVHVRTGALWARDAVLAVHAGPATGDGYGRAVAISSDAATVLVGVPGDDLAARTGAGSARVFVRSGTGWALEQVLVASDAATGDWFGGSVALSADGSTAVIGVSGDDLPSGPADAGSARVFVRNSGTWSEVGVLRAVAPGPVDTFGAAVAVSADGRAAFVGAPRDDDAGSDAGSVTAFALRAGVWIADATLAPSGGLADNGYFGSAIATSSDGARLVVGAPAALDGPGSARVFALVGGTWTEEAIISSTGLAIGARFGAAVAMSADGSVAVAGVPGDGARAEGTARVFERRAGSWVESQALAAAISHPTEAFGSTVAASSDGRLLAIGGRTNLTATTGLGAGSVRLFARAATAWTEIGQLFAADAAAADDLASFSGELALSADGSVVVAGALSDDTSAQEAGSVRVWRFAGTLATACDANIRCASGHCVDGVCCDEACGGGARDDCEACSAAAGGATDGTCGALSGTAASAVVCRAGAGPCDTPDVCSAGVRACPADRREAAGVECRATSGGCDLAELCDGVSTSCGADLSRSAGAVCRASTGACDLVETCDGSSRLCDVDLHAPVGTTCRGSAGDCDPAEVCDGASGACPGDVLYAPGRLCRASIGTCDVAESCTGSSAACPADVVLAADVSCRDASGPCDLPERCTGSSGACPVDAYAPETTLCGPAPSGECDAPDHCAGTSADCVPAYLVDVECRAASGACDAAERCTGDGPSCPTDVVASAGLVCRDSTNPSCDPAESCDGTASVCPTDTVEPGCMPVDAGAADTGPGRDGAIADAGSAPPVAVAACTCSHARSGESGGGLVAAVVLAQICFRTRRERSRANADRVCSRPRGPSESRAS